MLVVTSQSLQTAVYTPLWGIPHWVRNLASTTVRKVKLVLECLRHSRKWEDVFLDSFACKLRRSSRHASDESDITAVELAALHHEPSGPRLYVCHQMRFSVHHQMRLLNPQRNSLHSLAFARFARTFFNSLNWNSCPKSILVQTLILVLLFILV